MSSSSMSLVDDDVHNMEPASKSEEHSDDHLTDVDITYDGPTSTPTEDKKREPEGNAKPESSSEPEPLRPLPLPHPILRFEEFQELFKDELAKCNFPPLHRTRGPMSSIFSSCDPDSVPTDLFISDLPADYTELSVVYEVPEPVIEEEDESLRSVVSEDNLIPEMREQIKKSAASTKKTDKSLTSILKSSSKPEKEDVRLAKLKTRFDTIPPIRPSRPSLTQLQNEYTENRIKSHKKICELSAEVTVKSKESEMLELQLTRSQKDLKAAKSKLASKDEENRQLRQRLTEIERVNCNKTLELTLELQKKSSMVEAYERMFSQADQLTYVDSVAPPSITHSGAAKVVSRMSVPFNLRCQLQQSSDLAQRMKDERDHLQQCRDDTQRKLNETDSKYTAALIEVNKLKIGEDTKLASARASLQLKSFELERVSLVLEDYQLKYKSSMHTIEDLRKRVEDLQQELNDKRCEHASETTRLSLELDSTKAKLALYEEIENTLDEMIITAAEVSGEPDILNLVSPGPGLPTDPRRRLEQALDLARRNFQLKTTVEEQKKELFALYDERQKLRQDIKTITSLNGESVTQLIEAIVERNREINKLRAINEEENKELEEQRRENKYLHAEIENHKKFHSQFLELYHSRHRINQAVNESDGPSPVDSIELLKNDKPVTSGHALLLTRPPVPGPSTRPLKREDSLSSTTFAPRSSSSLSFRAPTGPTPSTASIYTFGPSRSRLQSFRSSSTEYPEPPPSQLQPITEESEDGTFQVDSIQMDSDSNSSISSANLFPPPNTVAGGPSMRVSALKLPQPSKTKSAPTQTPFKTPSTTATGGSSSATSSTSGPPRGSKPLKGRKVHSSDLVAEHTKMNQQPVALKLTKVKKSHSHYDKYMF